MPFYLDRHELPEIPTVEQVAELHVCDIELEKQYDVRFLTYWYFGGSSAAFCLVEAPSRELVERVHRESHGFVPADVIEVEWHSVESFLGPIHEPEPGEPWEDSALRTMLCTVVDDESGLTQRTGGHVDRIIRRHDVLASQAVKARGGRNVGWRSQGMIGCFASPVAALESALAIQQSFGPIALFYQNSPVQTRIGISSGEPAFAKLGLFEAAVNEATAICRRADAGQILVSRAVRDACVEAGFEFDQITAKESPEPLFSLRGREAGWTHQAALKAVRRNALHLSERELEVLQLITLGKTNQEIANSLFISQSTVATHVRSIFGKAEVANRAEAASYAIRHRLV